MPSEYSTWLTREAPVKKTESRFHKKVIRVPAMRSDDELLRDFRSGDDEAFLELYSSYAPRVAVYIGKIIINPPEVKDLFQTVWMKMLAFSKGDERTWQFEIMLFRIARNEAFSFLRKRRETRMEEGFDVAAPHVTSMMVEQTELKALLDASLEHVPLAMREVFVLKEYDELSFAEIADVIGITESLARVRYHRAKHILRKFIRTQLHITERENPSEFI